MGSAAKAVPDIALVVVPGPPSLNCTAVAADDPRGGGVAVALGHNADSKSPILDGDPPSVTYLQEKRSALQSPANDHSEHFPCSSVTLGDSASTDPKSAGRKHDFIGDVNRLRANQLMRLLGGGYMPSGASGP